jgi:hypothetical protein
VYAEPDAPQDAETARAIAGAVQDPACYLGAKDEAYTERLPQGWRGALRS